MNAHQNIAQHRLGHVGTSLVGQTGCGTSSGSIIPRRASRGEARLGLSRDGTFGHNADGVGNHPTKINSALTNSTLQLALLSTG